MIERCFTFTKMQIEINIFRDHPCAGYKCRDLSSIHFADDYYPVVPIRGNSTTYLRRYEIESTERCVDLNYESILHTYVFSFFFLLANCLRNYGRARSILHSIHE